MTYFTLPAYTVQYQPQPPLIRATILRPLSAIEFTEACELLLVKATSTRCPFWLLDGRADRDIRPPDVYEWLAEEFLPRMSRALGHVPSIALLVQPRFWIGIRARRYAPPYPGLGAGVFRTNWFIDEGEALAWLGRLRPLP